MGMTHATPMVVTSVLVVGPHFPWGGRTHAQRARCSRAHEFSVCQTTSPVARTPPWPVRTPAREPQRGPRPPRRGGAAHRHPQDLSESTRDGRREHEGAPRLAEAACSLPSWNEHARGAAASSEAALGAARRLLGLLRTGCCTVIATSPSRVESPPAKPASSSRAHRARDVCAHTGGGTRRARRAVSRRVGCGAAPSGESALGSGAIDGRPSCSAWRGTGAPGATSQPRLKSRVELLAGERVPALVLPPAACAAPRGRFRHVHRRSGTLGWTSRWAQTPWAPRGWPQGHARARSGSRPSCVHDERLRSRHGILHRQ